jgi:septal ring-binding cell division protein DamX
VSTPTERPQQARPVVVEAAPAQRQCPRCGAAMTDEQEWCLRCGAAVGTRIATAPGWRVPLIVTGLLVLLAAVAIAIAIIQLADDTDEVPATVTPTATPSAVETPPPTPTPTPTLTPDPAATATPTPTPTPSATPTPTTTPESSNSGAVAEWPAGENGWTVVLASKSSEDAARDTAEDFSAEGIPEVGLLNSDDFSSLKAGFWVVYSGQFDSQAEATDALDEIDAPDAYIRRIADD